MLEVSGLTVRYGQHRALEDAAIKVGMGEIVVILGANGAGKSTLLKAVSGICEGQVEGSVRLEGTELLGIAPNKIVDEGLALVPEGRGVFPELTVRENLILGAYSARARDDESANLERIYELFPKLAERGKQVVRTMSGGEQQMVAIGRAMMSNPKVLTLDEPSLGLSPLLSKELFQNLKKVRDIGLGVLLVEQNAKQSLAISDRGYLLENAHIVQEDSAKALMTDPAVQAAYLGAGGGITAPPADEQSDAPPADLVDATTAGFAVRPRSMRTKSADTLLGRSVSDLVASAGACSVEAAHQKRPASTAIPAANMPTDRLAAALSEIERAAKSVRSSRVIERRLPASQQKPASAPQRPAIPEGPPAVVEIYRAPRVEVYRRRDGASKLTRS